MSQQVNSASLPQILTSRFSVSELKTFCSDLGIDYETLSWNNKSELAGSLIKYLERRKEILRLIEVGKQQRPDIPWDSVLESDRGILPGLAQAQAETETESRKGCLPEIVAKFGRLPPVALFLALARAEHATLVVVIVVSTIFLVGVATIAAIPGLVPTLITSFADVSPTPTPTSTPTSSPLATRTATPSRTSTPTPSPSVAATATSSRTLTPTMSPSATGTATPSRTSTPAPSVTPTPTATPLLIQTYTIRRGDTLEGIANELLGHKDRSLEICVMNRGSIGKDCEAFAVSVALNNRIGAVIKIIPRSVLSTTVSLPYMYYDDEVYGDFAKDGEWIWYEVGEEDSLGLSNIADKYYGDWQLWPEICVFNRDKLGTESRCQDEVILIGMMLRIPMLTPSASLTPMGTRIVPTETTTPTQETISTPKS